MVEAQGADQASVTLLHYQNSIQPRFANWQVGVTERQHDQGPWRWLGKALIIANFRLRHSIEGQIKLHKVCRVLVLYEPGFPFWPSWSVYDSRLPAAMQRFSHCCQVRYSFRCRSGLRMLADHGVPAKPEGPLATPLPRRPSATRVRWLFRAVDVTLRAQVAPKSAAACRRTTSGSDAPPQAATNNIARASRAVRPSSSADAASSSATSF